MHGVFATCVVPSLWPQPLDTGTVDGSEDSAPMWHACPELRHVTARHGPNPAVNRSAAARRPWLCSAPTNAS